VAVGTGTDIWVKQLPDGPFDRLTFDTDIQSYPAWSSDGQYLTYSQGGVTQLDYDVWRRRADGTGTPELLLTGGELSLFQSRWSPDGEWMVFRAGRMAESSGKRDIVGYRPGVDSEVSPLIATAEFAEQDPALSPDGRWLAYTSNRTGRNEVYVSPFPNVDSSRVAVSTNGGSSALWAHSGSELFFLDAGRNLVAAKVETASGFRVLGRETLFTLGPEYLVTEGADFYDVALDDQRFLMARSATESDGSSGGARFILVVNWFTELRERMGN